MTVEHCPTCGATVRVVSGYEGTSHYEPLGTVEALAKEVAPLSQQLQGAVDPDDPKVIETLARVIENRHGTLRGIGSTLREALAEIKRHREEP